MSASEPGDVSRKVNFFNLPPEIHNEIYFLLVISPQPIKICSPRSKVQIRRKVNPSNFCQLLCVNKQMNAESAMMFYAVNTFTIGNGPFGSKSITNLHGLRAFIKRVPANHLSGIRTVGIEIHKRWFGGRKGFGTQLDAENLHSITRALKKHFKRLEVVKFSYTTLDYWGSPFDGPRLTQTPLARELTKMFRTLLKISSLARIEAYNQDDIDMKAVAEEILKDTPAAEILKIAPQQTMEATA
jgi:hypothetical protein